MVYYTADQHYFHDRIIEYTKRPYKNVKIMNAVLRDNHNRVVRPYDTVYIIGDFLFGDQRYIPIFRRIVEKLQRFSISSKLVIDRDSLITNENTMIALIIELIEHVNSGDKPKYAKTLSRINSLTQEQDMNFAYIYERLFFDTKIPVNAKIIVNKYANSHYDSLIHTTHFMAMVFELGSAITNYNKMKATK